MSYANFAVASVASTPSGAAGDTIVVTTGQGARFPPTPFDATIWPTGKLPDPTNAEVVTVTAVAGDTLTVTRGQESSLVRQIVPTDLIANSVTAKALNGMITAINDPIGSHVTSLEANVPARLCGVTLPPAALVVGRVYHVDVLLMLYSSDPLDVHLQLGSVTDFSVGMLTPGGTHRLRLDIVMATADDPLMNYGGTGGITIFYQLDVLANPLSTAANYTGMGFGTVPGSIDPTIPLDLSLEVLSGANATPNLFCGGWWGQLT